MTRPLQGALQRPPGARPQRRRGADTARGGRTRHLLSTPTLVLAAASTGYGYYVLNYIAKGRDQVPPKSAAQRSWCGAMGGVYEGAGHGYTVRDTPVYNKDAAERHFEELLALPGRAGCERAATDERK